MKKLYKNGIGIFILFIVIGLACYNSPISANAAETARSGDVYAFGWNIYGDLGLGDMDTRYIPTKIENLSNVKAIAAGEHHTLILLENGDVYASGVNLSGQLGLGDLENRNVPTKIRNLSNVKAIAAHDLELLTYVNSCSRFNQYAARTHFGDPVEHLFIFIFSIAKIASMSLLLQKSLL